MVDIVREGFTFETAAQERLATAAGLLARLNALERNRLPGFPPDTPVTIIETSRVRHELRDLGFPDA